MRLLPLPCGVGDLKRFGARGRSEIFHRSPAASQGHGQSERKITKSSAFWAIRGPVHSEQGSRKPIYLT